MDEATSNKCEGLMIKILDHEVAASGETVKEEVASDDLFSEDDALEVTSSAKGKKAAASPTKKSRKKLLLASYTPDKRADAWMKVKKDYSETGGDSLDLVPIGAWHGQGRKASWWSPILLGVYDPLTESYQAVCKCISGFTDQFYKDLNERYPKDSETCGRAPFARMQTGLIPQWYFKPSEVWEVGPFSCLTIFVLIVRHRYGEQISPYRNIFRLPEKLSLILILGLFILLQKV